LTICLSKRTTQVAIMSINKGLCTAGTSNCYDQLSAGFIENSFYALQKLTPANTKIVIGQPATKASAGAATLFNGQDSSRAYNAMCESYQDLNGQTQYGGSMTWEITVLSQTA